MTKYKITIEVTYLGSGADPSSILDAFQEGSKELLEAYGDTVDEVEVSVEDSDSE